MATIELGQLLQKAFFVEDVTNATEAIERARDKYLELTKAAAISYELVAPASPDESWLRERLLRPLVYFCESEGRPLPQCPGVFLSLFTGARLHCLGVGDVIAWGQRVLGMSVEEMRREWGTREEETAQR